MALKIYRQKRDFKKTPEPKGIRAKSTTNNLYIIQKHAASHLHYDFRIELKGVLLSWAVPKGPSLDPSVKRLAMHVEDHPVEYGSFEGIIPKGEYGGGTVMLWDKGQWFCEDENVSEAYHKGNLTFKLKAKKLNGRWKLIRINHNDKTWLLMKLKDEYAKPSNKYDITTEDPDSVVSQQSINEISENYTKVWGNKGSAANNKMMTKKIPSKNKLPKIKINLAKEIFPTTLYPQLALLVDKPPTGKNWIHEIKYDGYRLITFKKGKKVTILTRNLNDWTAKFQVIAKEVSKISVNNIILDGEVVVLDENQCSDFQLLQNSIKSQNANFIYYAFDLLYFDNYNLMSLPLLERKSILQKLIDDDNNIIRYSDHVFGSGMDILNKACELGLEGIVSKEIHSKYSQTRNKEWLKAKCTNRQEFVIGGFQKSKLRKYFKSLLLGTFNKKKELIYNGCVGTGFTQDSLKSTYDILSKHITNKIPFKSKPAGYTTATWVEPKFVAEVEFTEWTNSGTLRHPSFKGLRLDKRAADTTKEIKTPVKELKDTPKKDAKRTKTNLTKNNITPNKSINMQLTHPDKIFYPENHISKHDLVEYYECVQEWMLPYVTKRPITLVRCPKDYTHCFYQKHMNSKLPAGVYGIMIKEKTGQDEYIYIKDFQGLIQFPQLGALEIHPWGSRIEKLEYPDTIIFDLDPAPNLPWKKIVKGAFVIKEILEAYNLKSFVKTTGGKGLHIVVPIKAEYDWNKVKIFSKVLVECMVQNNPNDYINVMTKSKRTNKIFVDYLRNQRGATAVAPYSPRARKFAPVSTPIAWDELTHNFRDTFFTIETLPARLAALKKDPWKDYFAVKQSLRLKNMP